MARNAIKSVYSVLIYFILAVPRGNKKMGDRSGGHPENRKDKIDKGGHHPMGNKRKAPCR